MSFDKRKLVGAILFTAWASLLGLGMAKNIAWLIWPMLAIMVVFFVYIIIEGLEMMA